MSTQPDISALDDQKLEALVETMFYAATADGEFSDPERAEFVESVMSLTQKRLDSTTLDALVKVIGARAAGEGREARLQAAKRVLDSDKLRTIAFELTVRIVAADGIVRTSEREHLLELAEAFELDRDKAADLVARGTSS